VNEAVQSLLGCAIKKYAERRGETNFDNMMMASTFALENFPKSVEEIKLGNQWVP